MGYRFFYNADVSGDILFILIDAEKKAEKTIRKKDVAAIYAGNELIGINLFNASHVFAFKSQGIIYAPSEAMLKAVNPVLKEAGLSELPYPLPSGYAVASISAMEEHPLDEKAHILSLDLGGKKLTTVSWYPELQLGEKVVVALEGTILYDGSVFHAFVSRNIPNEASLMSAKELGLGSAPGAYEAKDGVSGSDFFGGH
jgi:tRNA-binding protein